MEREVKSGGGGTRGIQGKKGERKSKTGIGGKIEAGGRSDVERGIRGRRWHWQTKRYDPAALSKGSGGWHHSRTGLVTGGEGFFLSRHLQKNTAKKRLQGKQETERKKAGGTSVYICVNYVN